MKEGFVTALGTPVDRNGDFIAPSFVKHVEDQVAAGAAGLLVMGSMGMQPCIKDSDCPKVAAAAAAAVKGACPVFVGVMDNSVGRVLERIKNLGNLKIDGVVATTPYYFACDQPSLISFFTSIAKESPYPLYLYDLPTVTKTKITLSTVERLASVPNIRGIKTADLSMARNLAGSATSGGFELMFADLDIFDVAYAYGIKTTLDGIYSMCAPLVSMMCTSLKAGSSAQGTKALNDIIQLRGTMLGVGVWQAFTYSMNLLGFEGRFHPDYLPDVPENELLKVKDHMAACGLLG